MILTHGANSLPRGSNDPDVIGGRKYRTVTIGEQTWLAENLDFKFDVNGSQIPIGLDGTSLSDPRANYYNNDEPTFGVNGNKFGLLYNWAAVKYLDDNKADLIPGWHVATSAEWGALASAVGGTSVAGKKLKSTTDWSSGAGTDDYGFSAFPAGYYDDSFSSLGVNAYFWTATEYEYSSRGAYARYFISTRASMSSSDYLKSIQYSVRLVKDA